MERETYFDGYSYQPLSSKVECVQALGKLEDAQEQGRLVVLPCKVGQSLYSESFVKGMVQSFEAPDLEWIVENANEFGKTVFFT